MFKGCLRVINPGSISSGKATHCPFCLKPYVELNSKIVPECLCGTYFIAKELCSRHGMKNCKKC